MILEATLSPDTLTTEHQCVFGNLEDGGGAIFVSNAALSHKIFAGFHINGSYRYLYSNETLEIGKKYNVILYYDGFKEELYINGVLNDSLDIIGKIKPPNSSTVMALGGNPEGNIVNWQYFNGKVYDANIYQNNKVSKEVYYGYSYGELPILEKENYLFLGWNTNENGTGDYITSTSKVSILDNHTLYAIWKENE